MTKISHKTDKTKTPEFWTAIREPIVNKINCSSKKQQTIELTRGLGSSAKTVKLTHLALTCATVSQPTG